MKKINSILFIPAKEKMVPKIGKLGADAYIIDLEESVEEECKENARTRLAVLLNNTNIHEKIFVRVNRETIWEELQIIDRYPEIGIVVPKFETIDDFGSEEIEIFRRHELIALVETARGVVNIEKIASDASVNAVAFGAEDYTVNTGMKKTNENLFYVKSRLVLFAKAYGKAIYDTPSFDLHDVEKFVKEVQIAVDMGFDGKLAIHPKQIDVIMQLFNNYDIDWMKKIVEKYEEQEGAVLLFEGHVYEQMHIDNFKKIIREYE